LTTPSDDGVDAITACQQSTDDRRLLITLSVQQRDGRLGVTVLVSRIPRRQLRLMSRFNVFNFLGRIVCTFCVDAGPILTDNVRSRSICVSVCLLSTTMSCPVQKRLNHRSCWPEKSRMDWGPDPHGKEHSFEGYDVCSVLIDIEIVSQASNFPPPVWCCLLFPCGKSIAVTIAVLSPSSIANHRGRAGVNRVGVGVDGMGRGTILL